MKIVPEFKQKLSAATLAPTIFLFLVLFFKGLSVFLLGPSICISTARNSAYSFIDKEDTV